MKTPTPGILGAIIATLLAGGTGYGYTVVRDNQADIFESSVHTVTHVVDGDTIDIENDIRIRLIGVDTPARGECGFSESRAFMQELLKSEQIYIEKDITGADRYDRLLRYIYVPSDDIREDDVLVQDALLRAGWARTLAIAPDNRYRDLFASAQEEAKRAELGIWGLCDPTQEVVAERQADSDPIDSSCTIKGNISEKSYGRNYFEEGCPNYNRIKIDVSKGEAYFCTGAEANAAGFTRSVSCANAF
jgi:micrococcal nuclease